MNRRFVVTIVTLVLGTAASGCANFHSTAAQSDPLAARTHACTTWFEALDAQALTHGARDGGEHRVPGFGHLRVDRFLASFRHELSTDTQRRDWYAALRRMDEQSRSLEAHRLPHVAWSQLGVANLDAGQARTLACRNTLEAMDLGGSARWQRLVSSSQVPDDYRSSWRVAGAYAALRVPFRAGVRQWERGFMQRFEAATSAKTPPANAVRWSSSAPRLDATGVASMLAKLPRNALGIPQPSTEQATSLLSSFAPDFVVQVQGSYDRPGSLVWRSNANDAEGKAPWALRVDTTRPTVYQRWTHTRWGGQVLIQLVYTIWFPQRPPESSFDLLAGELDGVVWRVTLGPDGRPWMHDSMHPCGCYHLFFPVGNVTPKPSPDPGIEWAFIPRTLEPHDAGQRVTVHVSSQIHDVVRVDLGPTADTPERYALVDDNELRSLPTSAGARRSIYRDDGLVVGTERGERYLFWPMGIVSAGAMRQ